MSLGERRIWRQGTSLRIANAGYEQTETGPASAGEGSTSAQDAASNFVFPANSGHFRPFPRLASAALARGDPRKFPLAFPDGGRDKFYFRPCVSHSAPWWWPGGRMGGVPAREGNRRSIEHTVIVRQLGGVREGAGVRGLSGPCSNRLRISLSPASRPFGERSLDKGL